MQKHEIKYLECDKTGYHYGQALNMVCLQPGCLDKALCCGACIEQFHQNHKVKPLKLIIRQAQELASKIEPVAVDTQAIFAQLESGKKEALVKLDAFRQKITETFANIEKSINNWYSSVSDQILVKTSGLQGGSNQLFESIHTQTTIPQMVGVVQKIIALIPKEDTTTNTIKENQLVERLSKINIDIKETLAKIIDDLLPKIKASFQNFNNILIEKDVWANVDFRFSPKLKHGEIILQNPLAIKSGATQTYKFSILQPEFKKNGITNKIAFKVKESSSNWLAFGVCHKNIIAQKNYSFVFNSIGHGSYLVSSNGGSWSHIDATNNNQVKTFKFTKGDTIGIQVNYDTNKVKFKKKGGNDSYELAFENSNGDSIHPCVLLYYPNDQVEIIENYTDW